MENNDFPPDAPEGPSEISPHDSAPADPPDDAARARDRLTDFENLIPEDMKATAYLAAAIETFRGPLPPPELLRQYNEIVPGSAKQILEGAAAQATHRQSLERTTVEGAAKRADRGLNLGFVSFVLLLAAALVCVLTGHDTAGIAFIGIDVAGLVGSFVFGSVRQQRERTQKFEMVHQRLPNGLPDNAHDRARAEAGTAEPSGNTKKSRDRDA